MSIIRQFRSMTFGLTLLAACTSAHCAVSMKATIGCEGTLRGYSWTPVSVQLENPTDEDIEGTLTVLQSDVAYKNLSTCSARVKLPANAKKLYHAYARFATHGGTAIVIFQSGGGVIAKDKLALNPASRDDWLIVSAGGTADRLSFLSGTSLPPRPRPAYSGGYGGQSSQAAVYVGGMPLAKLPDRPRAYDGVDMLVLSDATSTSAKPGALSAIAMWVASGGTLVVPAGPNFRDFQGDFYDDILPVRLTGTADLGGLPSLSVKSYPFPAGPVTVAKSVVKRGIGRVIVSESGVPIVAERSYGAGRVVYLALDPRARPFRDWDGQAEFWKSILQSSDPDPLAISTMSRVDESLFQNRWNHQPDWASQTGGMLTLISRHPEVRAPSFNSVGLFLIAYLILLAPVNYFVLRRGRRLELAWVTTPAVVFLFIVGAYAIGYTMKGSQLRLQQVALIEGSNDARYAHIVSNASLFSPARKSYDLRLSDPCSIAQAIPAQGNEAMPEGFVDDTSGISDVRMAMWSSRMFESASGIDLGGTITSSLTLRDGRLKGRITNGTRVLLADCILCYAGRRERIADLPAGGSATADGIPSPAPSAASRSALDVRLRDYAVNLTLGAGCPVLVARPASFQPLFSVEGWNPSRESAALCMFRLDFDAEGSYHIAAGNVSSDALRADSCNVERSGKGVGSLNNPVRVRMWTGGKCVIRFRLAVPPNGSVSSLALQTRVSGPSGNKLVQLSARNWKTGNWKPLAPAPGIVRLDPDQYIGASGDVRIRTIYTGGNYSQNVTLGISAEGKM